MFAVAHARTADARTPSPQTDGLLRLAESEFPNLTRAERALLKFADIRDHARADFAFAGTSTLPTDPSYDPVHADKWDDQRNVRAELIRWLCVDPDASRMVDPQGLRLVGARITGKLDLSHVHVPFAIALIRCVISDQINLDSAEMPKLDLTATYISEMFAPSLVVDGDADLGSFDGHYYGNALHASGEVFLRDARVSGSLTFNGAEFHGSPLDMSGGPEVNIALDISDIAVKGTLWMCCGFKAKGIVNMSNATVRGDLRAFGGQFLNAGGVALNADFSNIGGNVLLMNYAPDYGGPFEADGLVSFVTARVGANFVVIGAKFQGRPGKACGLQAGAIDVRKVTTWQQVNLQSGCGVNLGDATVQAFVDDEQSWPRPGELLLDGFTYTALESAPPLPPNEVAVNRLRWLALQPPGVHLQPYRQLAKYLHDNGDEAGARRVLIAGDDARYRQLGLFGFIWGSLLKWTVGYGHRPLLTLMWSAAVIVIGWALVWAAALAGLMRPTYPENTPFAAEHRYERLHPLLYSIDVFFPFVNLHQEHYWWPDSEIAAARRILGWRVGLSGSLVRYYLWFEIGAGWLLSAIFLAGVTGLLRND